MIVYHVIGITDFMDSVQRGCLTKPVRAWININEAERFSIQTGRSMILRLKFPMDTPKLEGHKGKAVILDNTYPISQIFNGWKYNVY
jgi:hypothetical protein